MTGFPSTWNSAAPKAVSDGLHTFAVLSGFNGDPFLWSIVRKRGIEAPWQQGSPAFRANQPPVALLDRKGRLNVFFNSPQVRHFRFDHPAVDLSSYTEITVPFSRDVGYFHVSYDAAGDTMLLAFNETSTWTLHTTIKYSGNDWQSPAPLPQAPSGSIYLYARFVRAAGRYALLAGEHILNTPNPSYVAAVLFEADSYAGPWQKRDLHRIYGNNFGTPYLNWVYLIDLQADSMGRLRALLHITEDGSGHTPLTEGIYLAKKEENYQLRHVAGNIDDAFAMDIDPSGAITIFVKLLATTNSYKSGRLVYFQSADGGSVWSGPTDIEVDSCNTCLVQSRNGSMLGGKELGFLFANPSYSPFSSVKYATVPLPLSNTSQRYDYWYEDSDGTDGYLRAFTDPMSNRAYYYYYDFSADRHYSIAYVYSSHDYYQVYLAKSNGSYEYYNSEGFRVVYQAPESYGYWYTDSDGSRDYIHIYRDPANNLLWWYVYDYDLQGNWTYTYVYYRGSYWYVEVRRSTGSFMRSDSTGFSESG